MIPLTQTVAGLLSGIIILIPAARADETRATNAKARLHAARKVYHGMLERAKIDPNSPLDPDKLCHWSRRWLEAERDLGETKEARIAAVQGHLERMKTMDVLVKQLFEQKLVTPVDVAAQAFFRLEAERDLAQAKGK